MTDTSDQTLPVLGRLAISWFNPGASLITNPDKNEEAINWWLTEEPGNVPSILRIRPVWLSDAVACSALTSSKLIQERS